MRLRSGSILLAGLAVAACQPAPVKEPPPAPAVAPAAAIEPEPAEYAGMLDAHNQWRREVQSPALHWSSHAARMAQSWADQLQREGCQMRHNPAPERKAVFGENIYRYWRSQPYQGYRRDPAQVVAGWGAEKAYYDAAGNRCRAPAGSVCGHYTQLVWNTSLQVGCGRAHCGDSEIWVCNYYPRGNYVGVRPFWQAGDGAATPQAETD